MLNASLLHADDDDDDEDEGDGDKDDDDDMHEDTRKLPHPHGDLRTKHDEHLLVLVAFP